MRVSSIEFSWGNISQDARGWVCRVWFQVATANQFTDETHLAFAGARWRWLAYWRAMRNAKKLHSLLAAKRGERAAMGWR